MNATPNEVRYQSIRARLVTMRTANELGTKTVEAMTVAIDAMASGGLSPMAVTALRQMHALLGRGFQNIDELIGLAEKLITDNMALSAMLNRETATTDRDRSNS